VIWLELAGLQRFCCNDNFWYMVENRWIAHVNSSSQSPVLATWLMVLAAFILGLPMLGSAVAFSAITSLSTIGLYLSKIYSMLHSGLYSLESSP